MAKKSFFMILFLICIGLMCISAQTFVMAIEVPKSPYYPNSNIDWWQYQFDGYRDYTNHNCGPASSAMVINYLKGKGVTTTYYTVISSAYPDVHCHARWDYCQANGHPNGYANTDWSTPGATTEQIISALSSENIQTHTFTGYDCCNDGRGITNLQNAIDQGKVCICLVDPSYYRITDCHSHWVVAYGYDNNYIYLNDPGYHTGQGFQASKSDFADALWYVIELSTVIVSDTIIGSLAPPPEHVYPLNNSTIHTTTPTFEWSNVSAADGYGLYIRDITSGEMVYATGEQPLYGTTLELPGGILENGRSYWWNMNSYNSEGWNPECSTHWKFTVQVDNYPIVNSFSVSPTSVTLGNSFDISYMVSDDIGLQQTELWRAIDVGGTPDWDTPNNPIKTKVLSGQTDYSGSFTDTPNSTGIYYYGMHVVDTSGNWSVEPDPPGPIMVTVNNPTVNPPTGVQATDGTYTDKVRITWNSVSGASYYRVYRATSLGGSKTPLVSWQSSTSYDDTSATPGTTYYYFVKAATSNSGSNASEYSTYNEGWRKLSPPTGIDATNGTYTDKIRITWNIVNGASYYHVYRATSSGGTKVSLGSWQGTTSYDDTSATPGQTYYYFIKAATNSSGYRESDYSSYDQGSCSSSTTPPQVTSNNASSVTANSAQLNGNLDSTGGITCEVWFEYGKTTSYGSSTPKQSKSSIGPFYETISSLDLNTTYHFKAYASNSEGTVYGADKIFTTPMLGDFGSANGGSPDCIVDFEDLMIFALAYGSTPSDANWNPVCDIYPDDKIDFEDLMVFAMHYGETCADL